MLEFGRIEPTEDHVEPVMRGNTVAQAEGPPEPVRMPPSPVGYGDEVVGPALVAHNAMGTMLISG